MVLNNGFKFTNYAGDCFVENDTLICKGDQLIQIFDFEAENTVLLDALAVNYKQNADIIKFTQKYGPIIKWSMSTISNSDCELLCNHINNETFMDIKLKLFARFDISLFRMIFERLQNLINLITAYRQNSISSMLRHLLLLILNAPAQSVDEYHQNLTADISTDLESYITKRCDKPLLEIIYEFVNTSDVFSVSKYDLESSFFIDLLSMLCKLCHSNNLSIEDIIEAKLDFNSYVPQDYGFVQTLQICSAIVIADEINFVVCDIKPYFRVQPNGEFIGDWIIPDLLSAIYLDIFLKNSNSILLKKCENPTCGQYFETTVENTTKKYCSTRCAQLMAKRKQREREKKKNTDL